MYTRCPACHTEFLISREQLEAARGRVRCGECMTLFDARHHLGDETHDPSAAPAPERAGEAPLPAAPFPARGEPVQAEAGPFPGPHVPARGPARGWLVVNLLLLLLLLGQYLWFNREPLAGIPALRPAMAILCAALPCGLAERPEPGLFQLTSRTVQSHPAYEDALLIDATFVNTAATPRPYPGLELVFTDPQGQPLASRRFQPAEYLDHPPKQMLAPGGEAHVVLELLDPGALAVGYEFRFF